MGQDRAEPYADCAWFGFSAADVRRWEKGRRQPEAAARVLLLVIASRPDVVDEVLAAAMPQAA
jgi:hypothetical protein